MPFERALTQSWKSPLSMTLLFATSPPSIA